MTNHRAARRARHGASHRDSATLRWSAAGMAGILGFAMVFSSFYVYKLQHTYTTQDIGSLLGIGPEEVRSRFGSYLDAFPDVRIEVQ